MKIDPSIFKEYDIRAVAGEQLDEAGVERIGQAIVAYFAPKTVAIGRDMRISSDSWYEALARGITKQGVDVVNLGTIATDMTYYAAGTKDIDLAVMISASHNPPQYNGMKIVKRGAEGVSGDSGIYDLRDLVTSEQTFQPAAEPGKITELDVMTEWVKHALAIVDVSQIKPLKVVVDAGNGMAGKVIPAVAKMLPIEVIPMYFELDGTFPNHLANPLLEETQEDARAKVIETGADLALMFDGDGDRMFILDEKGQFVSGTITTAMVAKQLLQKRPGSPILYNAICGRIVPETVEKLGGKAVRTRVGHTIIKREMKKHGGLFAGEHSGHYFFADNFNADSGLIAGLVVLELLSQSGKTMSSLVADFDVYPSSGEINFSVENKEDMMKALEEHYASQADSIDHLDGVSIWTAEWWANIRPSNTQPVLRLNIEANDADTLKRITKELITTIEARGGERSYE